MTFLRKTHPGRSRPTTIHNLRRWARCIRTGEVVFWQFSWCPRPSVSSSARRARLAAAAEGQPSPPYAPGPILARFLDGPMKGCEEIIVAERVSMHDHWYVNFGYYANDPEPPRLRRRRPAAPRQPPHRRGQGALGRPQGRRPRSAGPLRRQEDPLLVPQGRHAHVSPVRNPERRQRPEATDRRPGRRHRGHVPAGQQHRLLLGPLPAVRQLLVQPRDHALPLRRRGEEHPHVVEQQRPRQHALGAARRTRPLHAVGIRGPQPGALSPPVDDESRRHGADGLLRQRVRRHRDARRQADRRHEQGRLVVLAGARHARARRPRGRGRSEPRARHPGVRPLRQQEELDPRSVGVHRRLLPRGRGKDGPGDGRPGEHRGRVSRARDAQSPGGPRAAAAWRPAARGDHPFARRFVEIDRPADPARHLQRPQDGRRRAGRHQEAARVAAGAQAGELLRRHGAADDQRQLHAGGNRGHGAGRARRLGQLRGAGACDRCSSWPSTRTTRP